MSDGTLIQWGKVEKKNYTPSSIQQWGNGYLATVNFGEFFTIPFVDVPSININSSNSYSTAIVNIWSDKTQIDYIQCLRMTNFTQADYYFDWIAIGKWK